MRLFWVIGVRSVNKKMYDLIFRTNQIFIFFQYGKVFKERERGEKWVKFLN